MHNVAYCLPDISEDLGKFASIETVDARSLYTGRPLLMGSNTLLHLEKGLHQP